MQNLLIKSLSILLTLYFGCFIIFDINYTYIAHSVNVLVICNFVILLFITKKTFQINEMIRVYALFLFVALASALWGVNFDNPSFRSLQLFIILINLVVIYNSMKKFDLQNTFLYGVLLGSFVNYVFIFEIIPAPFPIIDAWGERYFGTVGNANSLAIVMIASIFASIVLLHKKKEIHITFLYYQYINILLAAYMIMLTLSKKGVIFGFILIFIFLTLSIKSIKKPKTILKLIMLSAISIVLIYNFITLDDIMNTLNGIERRFSNFHSQITSQHQTKFGSTGERKYFIELGWGLFKDKPLFGYGLDNFREFAHTYSHNNYIELLVGVGLVGMMIFYSIYFFLVKKILRMKDAFLKTIFLVIVCIILLMDFALVSYRNKILLFLLLFIFVIVELENKYKIKSVDNEKKD